MDCNSLVSCHYVIPCLALPFLFICAHFTAAPLVAILISMMLSHSSRLPLFFACVNGSDSRGALRSQVERRLAVHVRIHPSWQQTCVTGEEEWQQQRSANLSVGLTPGKEGLPLFIRSDSDFYTFCWAVNNTGSWNYACFATREDAEGAVQRANWIKVLQTEWRQQKKKKVKVFSDFSPLLLCQKAVLIQQGTVSHSITCSMCGFQGFMQSSFWAGPIFHTHPHLQHSAHCLSKQECTWSVWHLCVRMFHMHLYSVCVLIVLSGYFQECKLRHVPGLLSPQCSAVGTYHRSCWNGMCTGVLVARVNHLVPLMQLEGMDFWELWF